MSKLLVICNFPDFASARKIADDMVTKRYAACANILDGCTSVFRWNEKVEIASEIPVFFKTTLETYAELEIAIRDAHPYDVPEIIALPIEFGLESYLQWVDDNVAGSKTKTNNSNSTN